MSTQPPLTHLIPGTQLYKYKLCHKIGGGNFGEVWLAEDRTVGQQYAIKILKTGTPIHQRLREAHIGHALKHNNLVRVHQADVIQIRQHDYVVIAMDYLPKGPVTKLANTSLFLKLPDVMRLGKDILRGLEYLHGHDFFHNDVKPENVLVGSQDQGMLTDYGIVGITQDGAPVPPPTFYKIHAAPEVISQNTITAQTDVYQTGLTLFRMLVGLDSLRQKFNTLGEQAYYSTVVKDELILTSDFPAYIPSRIRRIIQKATHPDVASRYLSALEMRRELEKLNYSGYWTVESSGDFVGYNGAYLYRYRQICKARNRFDVEALKRNRATNRETRVRKFCHNNVTNSSAKKVIERYIRAVVQGI